MKYLPITAEVREELEALKSAAWGSLNGKEFTREDRIRAAHLTSEILRFDNFGSVDRFRRAKTCPAALYHGPGHQSRCGCVLPPGHDGRDHVGESYLGSPRFRGLVAFTS